MKSFIQAFVVRLQHYNDEHEIDWDLFVQPIIYEYNAKVHRTTRMLPFSFFWNQVLQKALVTAVMTVEEISRLLSPLKMLRVEKHFLLLRSWAAENSYTT